jgi:hypothetical protein
LCAIDSRINHPSQSQIGIGLGYPLPPMKLLSCAAKSVSPEKSEVSWNDRRIVNSMQMCVWNILDLFFSAGCQCCISYIYMYIYTINKLSNIQCSMWNQRLHRDMIYLNSHSPARIRQNFYRVAKIMKSRQTYIPHCILSRCSLGHVQSHTIHTSRHCNDITYMQAVP